MAPPVAPCRRTHPQWGGWGSWDGLEMGTCPDLLQRHSGPGSAARRSAEYQRFFSHASARPGPLQQIWTTGAARALAGDGRRLGGGRDEHSGDPSGRGAGPPDPSGRLRRPDVHFALESAVPTVVLECKMHVSARIPPLRRPGPRAGRPVRIVQEPERIHSGVALGSRGKSRSSSAQSSALTAGVISGRRS